MMRSELRNCCGRWTVVVVFLSFVLVGCASPRASIALRVVDAETAEPLQNARITIGAMSFFLPVYPYPTIGGDDSLVRSRTDARGFSITEAPTNRPSQIRVEVPFYEPWSAILTPRETKGGVIWLISEPLQVEVKGARRLEVSLEEPSAGRGAGN